MLSAKGFLNDLSLNGIDLLAGVPDSLLSNFCSQASEIFDLDRHLIMANEGNAVALAAGYHLATKKIAAVYMQNSGLGNAINPLTSLTDALVYKIPMLLIIGWRGEPGKKDEPQHAKQGLITEDQLRILDIPYFHLDSDSEPRQILEKVFDRLKATNSPVAILVSSGTFYSDDSIDSQNHSEFNYEMTREEAIEVCIESSSDSDLIISTTGKASRELYEGRKSRGQRPEDFLTVGGMGHASSIALGVCLGVREENLVICLDGDGAALMHLGAMAIIGSVKPKNFLHVLLNNGAHESVGGQPTVGYKTNFVNIAIATGYEAAVLIKSKEELRDAISLARGGYGPIFIDARIKSGSRNNLGRPSSTPIENKIAFMSRINGE